MSFYRLIKPDWGKPLLDNGKPNDRFVQEIKGPNTHEGYNFSSEFLTEQNQKGYNVYFFPNHPSRDVYKEGVISLSGANIEVFNFLFVDMDLKDKIYESKEQFLEHVMLFPVKPSMVVNSGNGIHVYWAMNTLTRDEYVFAQLALIKYFKTDDSVFTALQLMRCPGYYNTKKHGNYILSEMLTQFSSNKVYELSDFPQDIFKALDKNDLTRGQRHLDRLDGKLVVNIPANVDIDELPEKFFDFVNDSKNKYAHDLFYSPKETYGDRSRADMKLANILFSSNFSKKEAFQVLSNTQKALSHNDRKYYAGLTVDKVYDEKLLGRFKTVGQHNRTADPEKNLGDLVRGTWYFDSSVLGNPWRKRELLGLIAGTGVGKTTVTLKWMRDTIENNPDNDDIYVFFSLEMAVGEIITRWNKLVGMNSPLADRLYVIGAETDNFEPRQIGLQEILEDCQELKRLTGKNLAMVAIDHIGIIARHINIKKSHTFGISSEANSGFGDIRTLGLNSLAKQLKPLSKLLDTFMVILTQTTKEKQGAGDLPLGVDAAYGISDYENIMDRIITIWQPLARIQHECVTRFLAWQYVKIRNKDINDKIQIYEPKLLTFELGTGELRISTPQEYEEFSSKYPKTIEMREAMSKKKGGVGYSIHGVVGTVSNKQQGNQ